MMRYVRYAAAMMFALLAVGFVALWVRSYYHVDLVRGTLRGGDLALMASRGLAIGVTNAEPVQPTWIFTTMVIGPTTRASGWPTFFFYSDGPKIRVSFPLGLLAVAPATLAALFAFKRTWRYSLRTILVATTLLAGLLGLAVYAV